MKAPRRLRPLIDDGLIDEVICPLMSGKEAQLYVVLCGEHRLCAKVFKESGQRSFKQAVQYQEGRRGRNSRRNRAMNRKTRYGQREQEQAWLNAEVDALRCLSEAGVRVPRPSTFVDGVLLMELICDEAGDVAPQLGQMELSAERARHYHDLIIAEIVRMLCAGLIHGDLSPFNILVDDRGPVIIDLPQAVNAAGNNSAEMMLKRDVDNIRRWFARFAPELEGSQYGGEIWALYEAGSLQPESRLTGVFAKDESEADLDDLMAVIDDTLEEEARRIEREKESQSE